MPIIIYLKWIMHYLAIYLVLFRAFVIAAMRKSIRGNSNLQNWVENGLKFFFPCSMLKNVWVQAVKIRITTCILTVSYQFRKKCTNNWQICMFLKTFEQRIPPTKAFFLLFSSQNSTFFPDFRALCASEPAAATSPHVNSNDDNLFFRFS